LSKALLHDGVRSVSTEEVLAALDAGLTTPPVPEEVAEWVSLDAMLRIDATNDQDATRGVRLS
jgi:hypothetical protein